MSEFPISHDAWMDWERYWDNTHKAQMEKKYAAALEDQREYDQDMRRKEYNAWMRQHGHPVDKETIREQHKFDVEIDPNWPG